MPPFFPPLPRRWKVVFYSTPLNVTALRQSACRSSSMHLNPKCAEREKKNSQTKLDREFFFFLNQWQKKRQSQKSRSRFSSCRFFLSRENRFKKAGNKKKSRKTVPKSCPTWPWSTTTWSSSLAGTLGMFIVVGPCSPMEAFGTGKGGYEVHLRNEKYWKRGVRRERFDTFKKKGI